MKYNPGYAHSRKTKTGAFITRYLLYSTDIGTRAKRWPFNVRWYKKKFGLIVSSLVSVSIQSLPCLYPRSKLPWLAHPIWDRLHVLGGRGTSDNLDQLASNDGLSGSVEENLVLVDHLSGVLGGVL